MEGSRQWILAIIGIGGFLFSLRVCDAGECLCWDQMDSTQKSKLLSATFPTTLTKYQYGAMELTDSEEDDIRPCVCEDVTQMTTPLKIDVNTIASKTRTDEPSEIRELETQIMDAFISLLDIGNVTANFTFVAVKFISVSESPSDITTWTLKIGAKGRAITEAEVKSIIIKLTEEEDGTTSIPGVGKYLGDVLEFTTLKCSEEPPDKPTGGSRIWEATQTYPGDKAYYSCGTGFILAGIDKNFSICGYDDAVWSHSGVNITCTKGCNDEPPSGPYFTVRNWDPSKRKNGDEVVYSCMNRYRSVTGVNGTSTCTDSKWTELQADFRCEQILCSKYIPQVPAYGFTDWDRETRYVDTWIRYSCLPDYRSTVKEAVVSICENTGLWKPLPARFDCVDVITANKMGIFDDSEVHAYDYYLDGPQKVQVDSQTNWFWFVTIPAILAMCLVIVCCLCCTRTDSPLFILCTGNTKNVSYIPPR